MLNPNSLYATFDRFVCGAKFCAGMTARWTGHDIDGRPLDAVTEDDVRLWCAEFDALTCQCGHLRATVVGGHPETVNIDGEAVPILVGGRVNLEIREV